MTMLAPARLDRAVSNHIHRYTIVHRPQETFASGNAIMHTIAEKPWALRGMLRTRASGADR
jgi:hypothetical protein